MLVMWGAATCVPSAVKLKTASGALGPLTCSWCAPAANPDRIDVGSVNVANPLPFTTPPLMAAGLWPSSLSVSWAPLLKPVVLMLMV